MEGGKVYDKIYSGETPISKTYYFRGKLRKKSLDREYYTFDVMSDFYYVSNDSLCCRNKLNRNGDLPPEEPFYCANGQVKTFSAPPPYEGAYRQFVYNENGKVSKVYNTATFNNIQVEHPRFGKVNETYWSHYSMQPNVLNNLRGDSHMGYPHIGTLYTRTGYELTGFHYPLDKQHGNGSVLFLENKKDR